MLLFPVFANSQEKRENGIYADFITNKGVITVRLDYIKTPMTVANFIGLAEGTITNATYPQGKPFYDGSIWHRVVKGHVIQGGEPSVVEDAANFEGNSTGYVIPTDGAELTAANTGRLIGGLTFASSADNGQPVAGSEPVSFNHQLGKT